MLYLTPASVSYLTQLIFSALIAVFLARKWRENQDAAHRLLTGFFILVTLFIGLLFLDVALLPTPRLFVVYLENSVLAAALVLLLQFVYRFPTLYPPRRLESYLVLAMSLLYAAYEIYFAALRFVLLADGWVEYRLPEADYALAVLFAWVPVVLFRQAASADERPVHWLRKLWKPQGAGARSARNFAFICLLLLALSVVNLLRGFSTVSTGFYNATLSLGILFVLWLFVNAYLNHVAGMTSFMVKLSGAALAMLLAVLGTVGWATSPAISASYRPAIADHQTLHFTPNAQGGYDVAPAEFHFETDFGEKLPVTSRGAGRSRAVEFTFPFYGQTYFEVYVTSVGLLTMGAPLYHPNLQNDYGHSPGIFPLLVDLEPASGGGVFARLEADRLIVTWDHVPALHHPSAVFTFQAVLYRDGSFDFTYNGLPSPLVFDPDAAPSANPWLRGVTPGLAGAVTLTSDLSRPAASGPQGILQDFYLDFRSHLHTTILPLALLVLAGSLLILAGLPLILHSSLVRPLESLLAGVRQMNDGRTDVRVPVWHGDEIVFLAGAFNSMAARLHSLVTGLEARVAERTAELEKSNAHLQAEMKKREAIQAQSLKQQRELAVLEEREKTVRDLHDGLGQMIGSINVQAQAAQTLLSTGQAQPALLNLEHVVRLAQDAHANLRNFILGLHEPSDTPQNFYGALHDYLRKFNDETGIQTTLSLPPDTTLPLLPPVVEEQLLRITQEALTNVRKHAAARKVELLISFDVGQLQVMILDDGVGFDPGAKAAQAGSHFGLGMMQERAETFGGRLEVRSAPGEGTKVLVFVPRLPASASDEGDLQEIHGLRLLLADDSPLFLEGLRSLLIARGLTVVGMARDGLEAQEKARLLCPDVIVMDVMLPRCSGLDAVRLIKAELPAVKIVMLTASEDDDSLFEAIKAGASGYLLKSLDINEFYRLLTRLGRGEAPLTPRLARRLLDEFAHAASTASLDHDPDEVLTTRQWQILDLVARGMPYKEVASALNLSEPTVKYHMRQILERLHIENRAQAIAYARRMKKT